MEQAPNSTKPAKQSGSNQVFVFSFFIVFIFLSMIIISWLFYGIFESATKYLGSLLNYFPCVGFNGYVNLLMAVGTLAAVLTALFGGQISALFFKPNLVFITENSKTQEVPATVISNGKRSIIAEKWLQISIKNIGNRDAKNVRLYFSGVDSNRVLDPSDKPDFKSYVGIPLLTSWVDKPSIASLPPNMERKWDICSIQENGPELSFRFGKHTPNLLSGIYCKRLPSDTFESVFFIFNVIAVAENADTARIQIKVSYDGYYKNDLRVEFFPVQDV